MTAPSAPPLARQRRSLLLALLVLSALSWLVVAAQANALGSASGSAAAGSMGGGATAAGSMGGGTMDSSMGGASAGLTMGMAAPLFLATWIVMMAAMMLPSAAPMILMFDSVQSTRARQGRSVVPAWIFTSAYLAVWAGFGVAAYIAAVGAQWLSTAWPSLGAAAPRVAGVVFVAAGLYQLTPLKGACLTKCRTPLQWVLGSWRNGRWGAFRMGIEHGAYCLGCCWLLFAILFPLGIMNVAAMAAAALVVLLEKTIPLGVWVGRAAGVALVAAGLLVVAVPSLLPTTM